MATVPNTPSPEGTELGRQLARMCDGELAGKPDSRCGTCAFKAGDHLANNSPATLMDALKCAMEGEPFWCHEHDRACAGWAALRFSRDQQRLAPWGFVGASDAPKAVVRRCRSCGCTESDCSGCIERTGEPCGWQTTMLCTACKPPKVRLVARAVG